MTSSLASQLAREASTALHPTLAGCSPGGSGILPTLLWNAAELLPCVWLCVFSLLLPCVSPAQVRVPVSEVAQVVRKLVDSQLTWQEVAAKYPQQKAAEEEQQL